jgi:hypothetical protein
MGKVYDNFNALAQDILQWTTLTEGKDKLRDQLADLRQTRSVQDYVFTFAQLTNKLRLTGEETVDRFYRGLKTGPKQEFLRIGPTPTSPAACYERALHVERLLTQMGANRNTNPPVTPPPTPRWSPRTKNSDAMEVDQVQLRKLSPKERQYLMDNQGCFRCRAVGVDHDHLKNCPRFNNQQPPRVSTPPKTPANDRPRRFEEIDGAETTSEEEGERYNDIDVATPIAAEINSTGFAINDIILPSPLSTPPPTEPSDKPLTERDVGDWMLNRQVATSIFQRWGTPTIDFSLLL